jgi:hypothetical protein
MTKSHTDTVRTFFHSLAAALLIAGALALTGHRSSGAGYAVGAAMSLFSLFSLGYCVPALFHEGATGRSTVLLQVTLLMKLPVYAVGLYFASRMGSAAAFAAFGGCALVPAVITAETLGRAALQSSRSWRRFAAMQRPIVLSPAVEALTRRVAEIKQAEACEAMALPSTARAMGEGA